MPQRPVSEWEVENDTYKLARLCFAMMPERREDRSDSEPRRLHDEHGIIVWQRPADALDSDSEMCHRNVIITNAHSEPIKSGFERALRPSGIGFGETGSVPNAFSAALKSPP